MTRNDETSRKIGRICKFGQNRAYILMAIARDRENPGLEDEPKARRIITSKDDIDAQLSELRRIFMRDDYEYRLYLTVNARDTIKTYFNFMEVMQSWMKDKFYGQEGVDSKFASVNSEWKSELHRPRNKDDSKFVFDYDESDAVGDFREALVSQGACVRQTFESPNGYHIITDAFNYTEFEYEADYEVKTDGMVFVGWIY